VTRHRLADHRNEDVNITQSTARLVVWAIGDVIFVWVFGSCGEGIFLASPRAIPIDFTNAFIVILIRTIIKIEASFGTRSCIAPTAGADPCLPTWRDFNFVDVTWRDLLILVSVLVEFPPF
jgi:hypothetical protein